MTNPQRGEITAELNGSQWTLCLTLGALAELENKFSSSSLMDLVGKFSAGNLSSREILHILGAGLRGGGHDLADGDVAEMRSPNGATGYAKIVAQLLNATFGEPQTSYPNDNKCDPVSKLPNPH